MLRVWSTKGSTYASVQAQCQAAVREGSNHPVTLKISRCAKNTSRGITRWASKFVIHLNLVLVNTEVFTLILQFHFLTLCAAGPTCRFFVGSATGEAWGHPQIYFDCQTFKLVCFPQPKTWLVRSFVAWGNLWEGSCSVLGLRSSNSRSVFLDPAWRSCISICPFQATWWQRAILQKEKFASVFNFQSLRTLSRFYTVPPCSLFLCCP